MKLFPVFTAFTLASQLVLADTGELTFDESLALVLDIINKKRV